MIRDATEEDVPRLVELGARFYEDGRERRADPKLLARFALAHIGDADKVCFVAGDPPKAVLAGLLTPHYFTGEPAAFKTAWYALPGARGHGARLLRAFETWSRERGARRLILSARHERTSALLTLLAYSPIETVFTKELP